MRRYVWPFTRSVLAGSVAGAAPMMVLTVPLGLFIAFSEDRPSWVGLQMAMLPLMVSTCFVAVGATLVGLPARWIMRRHGVETQLNYVLAGAGCGALFPLVVSLVTRDEASSMMANFGAIAGAVTGWTWWRSVNTAPAAPMDTKMEEGDPR